MKKIILITLLLQASIYPCFAQVKLFPGDASLDKSLLKLGTSTMGYSVMQNGNYVEVGDYTIEISDHNQALEVKTTLAFHNSDVQWKDHFVSDSKNFKAVSSKSIRDDRTLILNFGNEITGEFLNKKSGNKTAIKEKIKERYFDISIYPYLLRMLPLASGYKAILPVYDYEALAADKRFCNVLVKEVKTDLYISAFTGEHKVWKVSVFEESTKHNFQYYIDKESHKIWEIAIISNKGDHIILKDKETDFNPFKNKFNKEETLKLVNDGSATIEGVAFARDNENEGVLGGMAILNINKKQFAKKGTTVVLMPYTQYYEEWMELNRKQAKIKNAQPINLPQEAFECFKFTTIYDDAGHFEFTNLMPGRYLLSTSFGYQHTSRRSEVVGVSDVYMGGTYVGSNVYRSVFSYTESGGANLQKVVVIEKEGEKTQVKLKKTL